MLVVDWSLVHSREFPREILRVDWTPRTFVVQLTRQFNVLSYTLYRLTVNPP